MCPAGPECSQHSSFTKSEASVLIDLTTKSAKIGGFTASDGGVGLCFQLLFMMSLSTLPSLRWS